MIKENIHEIFASGRSASGKSLGDFDLIGDQKYILDQILAVIREKTVDAVLIAGDVYDKAIPSEAATNLLDYFCVVWRKQE